MRASVLGGILFGGLAAAVALAAFAPGGDGPDVSSVSKAEPRRAVAAAQLQLPGREALGRVQGELFASPPPPAAAPAPDQQPAPGAPPLPYRFAGKTRQGQEEQIFLAKGDAVIAVKEGDTLEGGYRVTAIGAAHIDVLYLPLGTRDRISVNSSLEVEAPPAPAPKIHAATPSAADTGLTAQLRWQGPQSVRAGASFNVVLHLSYDKALRAAPMQLRFEPGVLEAVSVRPGKFLGQGNFSYRVNPDGSIFIGATSSGGAPGADAELLVITLRPIKAGATAELNMASLSLKGAAGAAVAHGQVAAFRAPIAP